MDDISSAEARKARGAFFTPSRVCEFLVAWGIRSPHDRVLEPSCGEAAFLVAGAKRLEALGARQTDDLLYGVELHPESAAAAREALDRLGWVSNIQVTDFFELGPTTGFDAVIGNPPFVRYQQFTGEPRRRALAAARAAGVQLTKLASSWAAFTVHASRFLRPGGRLALVLPGELMMVNYAAEVRRFLLENFASVRVVVFTERVFPGVMEEVVLLLADGFRRTPGHAVEVQRVTNLEDLRHGTIRSWRPSRPDAKWTPFLLTEESLSAFEKLSSDDAFTILKSWGETTLGMVTGSNQYFVLTAAEAARHGFGEHELVRVAPPGSRHLRSLAFTARSWSDRSSSGDRVYLFRPGDDPSPAAKRYIAAGEAALVDAAYKCRVRKPWWRVPLLPSCDIFLTCMNSDVPRLCANRAQVGHLNSVHGVYLKPELRGLGSAVLPLASLSSLTLLGAELLGRSYGGGILKVEPREADLLPVLAPGPAGRHLERLRSIRSSVNACLANSDLDGATRIVDDIVLGEIAGASPGDIKAIREAREELHDKRVARGRRSPERK